jgi:sulfatase modifying factor 1
MIGLAKHWVKDSYTHNSNITTNLNEPYWSCNVYPTKCMTQELGFFDSDAKIIYNNNFIRFDVKNPNRLINFKKKINNSILSFNMITCPSTGGQNNNFMLGETDVTQELYKEVMGFDFSKYKLPNRPVEQVSWFDCLVFCNKLSDIFGMEKRYDIQDIEYYREQGKSPIKSAEAKENNKANGFRLPYRDEWLQASESSRRLMKPYPSKDDMKLLKRYELIRKEKNPRTFPVARKLPNELGFYDMLGNVLEWCWAFGYFDEAYDDANGAYEYDTWTDKKDTDSCTVGMRGLGEVKRDNDSLLEDYHPEVRGFIKDEKMGEVFSVEFVEAGSLSNRIGFRIARDLI